MAAEAAAAENEAVNVNVDAGNTAVLAENKEKEEKEIWNYIFRPRLIDHFHDDTDLTVYLFRTPGETATETITLSPFYQFYTIDDIKMAIYLAKGGLPDFAPSHQFLAKEPANTEEGGHPAISYIAADYFYRKDGMTASITNPFTALENPPDKRFVDAAGNRSGLYHGISRDRSTYEDVFPDETDPTRHIFHLYLLKDILSAFQTIKPLSEQQHNGYIMSYFPRSTREMDGTTLSAQEKTKLEELSSYFTIRQTLLSQIEEHYAAAVDTPTPSIREVKYLRFNWLNNEGAQPLDYQFYNTKVSAALPFLRYFPADNTAVTKLLVKGGTLPIPNIDDPCLLLHWAKEKTPTKDQDAIVGKVRILSPFQTTTPLYATLHILNDGTAAAIVDPKPLTKMTPDIHLHQLKESILDGIQSFSFAKTKIDLGEANLVATLTTPEEQANISSAEMVRRIKLFRGFFSEIPHIPGEHPLFSMRYKAVSNYFNESRVFTYLSQLASRHEMGDSESAVSAMIEKIQENFVVSKDEAITLFRKWHDIQTDNQPIEPTHDKYKLRNNSGIDIVITSKHPNYTFTLYRVDSYITLRRIVTLLALLFTLPKSTFDNVVAVKKRVEEHVASAASALVAEVPNEEAAPNVVEELGEEILGGDNMGNAAFIGMEEETAPEEEGTAAAAAAPAAPAAPAPTSVLDAVTKTAAPEPLEKIDVSRFFLSRLQKADKELFGDTKTSAKDKSVYARMCAANTSRQPLVMDELAFQRMMNVYRPDIDARKMDIVVYGYETPAAPPTRTPLPYKDPREQANRVFFVLKYGTKVTDQHYYLCCELFCIKDELLVRKDEFEGTVSRDGRPKEKNRCPFCNGTLITAKYPKEGETVIRRKVKANTQDKIHTYIGFLTSKNHSEGFGLPCCFTGEKLSPADTHFDPLRRATAPAAMARPGAAAPAPIPEVRTEPKRRAHYDYQDIIQRVKVTYILKAEAIPLEIGIEPQIGLLPELLNRYFQQIEKGIVVREHIRQKLSENANAFLRIAADNRPEVHADALLSAIAPFLLLNNAEQVKKRLIEVITPKVFVAANYGNLMLEFNSSKLPKELDKDHLTQPVLASFASTRLNIKSSNLFHIRRIYQSYAMFLRFLEDKNAVKQYRQFAPLLAQPGLLSVRGILFVVLEIRRDGSFTVICPPFGVTAAQMSCDIAFLFHKVLEKGDIWEPIFHTQKVESGRITSLTFQQSLRASWPAVLTNRIDGPNGFMKSCRGPNAIYTGIQQLKKNTRLISLSRIFKYFNETASVYGVVRDYYNHIVAVLFLMRENEEESDRTKQESPLITVPVLDDGVLRSELYLCIGWKGYDAASAEVVASFYKEHAEEFAKGSAGYTLRYTVTKNGIIEAIQLSSGIFIPVSQQSSPELVQRLKDKYALTEIPQPPTQFEWEINKRIGIFGSDGGKIAPYIRSEAKLNEQYQQFRLMFSEWIVSADAANKRAEITEILFHKRKDIGIDLPEYEKRARLRHILIDILFSWLTTENIADTSSKAIHLLRKNCRIMKTKGDCTGSCVWKENKCLLHIPETTEIDKEEIPVHELFLVRLLDELVRFPIRRDQLLQLRKKHVGVVTEVRDAVLIGDMYILPENTTEWAELLRMDCRHMFEENPIFHEEMSTAAPRQVAPVSVAVRFIEIPTAIAAVFGTIDDPKKRNFRLVEWDMPLPESMKYIASILHIKSQLTGTFSQPDFLKIVQENRTGIVLCDMTVAPPTITGCRYSTAALLDTTSRVYLLVKTAEGTFRFVKHVYTRSVEPIKIADLPSLLRYRVERLMEYSPVPAADAAPAAIPPPLPNPE